MYTKKEKDAIEIAKRILNDYESDGCTLAPDLNIKECCMIHDVLRSYNLGLSKKEADIVFLKCMRLKGRPVIGALYYTAVRLQSVFGSWKLIVFILCVAGFIFYRAFSMGT